MEPPDFLVIGHVAKDLTEEGYRLGGTVVYSALTAKNLGRNAGVITRVGPDLAVPQILEGIQVICLPSPLTTTFRNTYQEGKRRQYVYSVAESIGAKDVPRPWREVPIVHLGPIAGEIGADMIDLFPSSLVALTAQGCLRRWNQRGRVFPRHWVEAEELLERLDVLIVSDEDMAGDASNLRSQLRVPGIAVVTEGARGAVVHHRGQRFYSPARQTTLIDSTGAGDVFAAAFLVRLAETDDPREAARFANAAASLSVEGVGAESVPNRDRIEAVTRDIR